MREDTLLKVSTTDPWYANIFNYTVVSYIPPRADKKKIIRDSILHLWDDMYLYRVKRIKIKKFKLGDKIFLFNSRVHLFGHGKLHSKWKGPYLVLHTADHATVTHQCDDEDTFKAIGQHLKLFLEPNPQDFKKVDVLNFLEIE
jgi:hypothetical protein